MTSTEEAEERRTELEEQADLALIDLYDITAELDRRRRLALRALGPLLIVSGVVAIALLTRRRRSERHDESASFRVPVLARAAIWEAALALSLVTALRKWQISHTNPRWELRDPPIRRLGSGRPT